MLKHATASSQGSPARPLTCSQHSCISVGAALIATSAHSSKQCQRCIQVPTACIAGQGCAERGAIRLDACGCHDLVHAHSLCVPASPVAGGDDGIVGARLRPYVLQAKQSREAEPALSGTLRQPIIRLLAVELVGAVGGPALSHSMDTQGAHACLSSLLSVNTLHPCTLHAAQTKINQPLPSAASQHCLPQDVGT